MPRRPHQCSKRTATPQCFWSWLWCTIWLVNSRDFRLAYLETIYNTAAYRFVLSPTDQGLGLYDGRRFSILTAANPFSQPFSDAENAARNQAMKLEIEQLGFEIDWSYGEQADQSWREDGFVIFDAPLEVTFILARKFEQNAILYGEQSRVALAWCDNEELEWFFALLELN
jgi:Protein of unknown function (DUF3293)